MGQALHKVPKSSPKTTCVREEYSRERERGRGRGRGRGREGEVGGENNSHFPPVVVKTHAKDLVAARFAHSHYLKHVPLLFISLFT
jgi:hypothetical protein